MKFLNFYYFIKPIVPRRVRVSLRATVVRRLREKYKDLWPIDEAAGLAPANWPGWPGSARFAFVLTHDVERPEGLARCRQLAEVEMSLGFRSSFNFIPEGPYKVPADLRRWLVENGFEVGVHDLHHNGKLFSRRKAFLRKAVKINYYLREWEAHGFRAGFMHNRLPWQHAIKARYDASTFDTDPFEPFPDGARTIFPYLVVENEDGDGFIELPYTLAQDSTVFLLFREQSTELWRRKLGWVAQKGGMALLNSHPDYMNFEKGPRADTFAASHYRDFLRHVREEYPGQFWHALPRDVAQFAQQNRQHLERRLHRAVAREIKRPRAVKIWIDLENTPHIPFFNPIIRELSNRGYEITLTARDAYQTCEMANLYRMKYKRIGEHYGKNLLMKAAGLGIRIAQLLPFAIREKPTLALNHGSRAQENACSILGIPNVIIMDYEHTSGSGLHGNRWKIVPEVVAHSLNRSQLDDQMLYYSGIKEDVYVSDLQPDPSIVESLGLEKAKVVVTVRPPAVEAHYHNPEAELLFRAFIERALATDGVMAVLLPRNKRQEAAIRQEFPHWFAGGRIVIPPGVVNGLNLLWHSDLVVSGGGTMNREAAALGVPVYSIFRGTIGAVDSYLQSEGRLILVESVEEVESKIRLVARKKPDHLLSSPRKALVDIVNHLETIIASELES